MLTGTLTACPRRNKINDSAARLSSKMNNPSISIRARKDRSLLLVTLALALTTGSPAQSLAPPAATFQVETEEVLVDAVVTDKKGNIPRDLTAQDFKNP